MIERLIVKAFRGFCYILVNFIGMNLVRILTGILTLVGGASCMAYSLWAKMDAGVGIPLLFGGLILMLFGTVLSQAFLDCADKVGQKNGG